MDKPMPTATLCRATCRVRRAQQVGLAQTVESVDGEHHVRGLRRGSRSPRAHGDPDVGESQRRCVVDTVADHHRRSLSALGSYDLELVRR